MPHLGGAMTTQQIGDFLGLVGRRLGSKSDTAEPAGRDGDPGRGPDLSRHRRGPDAAGGELPPAQRRDARGLQGHRARAAGERNLLFPAALAVVVILGTLLVVYAREERSAVALEAPIAFEDHWHSAYGFYVCDEFLPDLPEFTDYTMPGRTYRYFDGDPLYAFGHGLSYTTFEYSNLTLSDTILTSDTAEITASVTVTNTGVREGKEAVLWFLFDEVGSISRPVKDLKFYEKKLLKPGESAAFSFVINPKRDLSFPNNKNERLLEDGYFTLMTCGCFSR